MEGLNTANIPDIVTDRERYERILYTPLDEAFAELERRRRDADLERKVLRLLDGSVPEPLRDKPKAAIARSIISPNYEVRRFAELVGGRDWLEPLYMEYRMDKLATNNESKRMLGRLYFFNGKGKNGEMRMDSLNIIDFAASNGRRIASVKTLWGQDLVRFHHDFFDERFRKLSHTFFDSSDWLQSHGRNAEAYYRAFLLLFVRHAVLFENVLLNKQEVGFTTRVFLPAFISIYQTLGLKPLIVTLEPTNNEDSRYWMCYPGADKEYVAGRLIDAS